MLPYVFDEALIYLFKYWDHGIHQGMRYGHELYTHVRSYPPGERLNAYALAFKRIQKDTDVCITVSKNGYSVWARLKAENSDADIQEMSVTGYTGYRIST